MREHLHVALDFDDVICDFVGGVCETISRDFDVTVTRDDITDWQFGQFIDQYLGQDWWSWLEEHADLWGSKFRPVAGAIGGIEKLRRDGHYVEIVTSKPKWAEGPFWFWMGKYQPSVDRVTIVQHKQGGKSAKKHEVTEADILVDDFWDNALDWKRDGRPAILLNRAHNAQFDAAAEGIVRVQNWAGILQAIDLESEGLL